MEPDIIILDEPTAGLDPKGRDKILKCIKDLHDKKGIGVILVSHSMEDVANYAERIIVMNKGKVMYDDSPHKVFSHYRELEKMGLAESIPYVGVKLVSLEQEDVLQIYLMRQLLEPLAAGEACKKITEEQIHELEEIHKEYIPIVEADEIDAKKLYLQNRKFHFAIYSISEMDRVCAMIESLWDTLSFFKLIYGRDVIKNTNGAKNMIAEHQGYIDALKDRDAERLKKSLYDTLGVRIDGISKETDYYTL